MSRIRIAIFACVILFGSVAQASILYQDNFDACTSNCQTGPNDPTPNTMGWAWRIQDTYSATHDGVTHYSGEITAPGRGGAGKSLKMWRHSNSWEGYTGSLDKSTSTTGDVYLRYYIKIPVAMTMSGCSEYWKWWRFNTSGGGQVYIQPSTGDRNTAVLNMWDGSPTIIAQLLNNTDTKAIWDGNWHCLQFHIKLSSTTAFTFWVDGVQKYNSSPFTWGSGNTGTISMIQHFSMGNHGSTCSFQSSWQAFEIDDFVIATTKAESDPIGSEEDTTPPTIFNVSVSGGQSCTSDPCTVTVRKTRTTTLTGTCSDDTGVSWAKWRAGAAPDGSNGTACTGSTSWSCDITGLGGGSNDIRIGCGDAAGNVGTATVNVEVTKRTWFH